MTGPHRCVFNSDVGFLPQRLGLSLRCECGRWMTIGAGRLGAKPKTDHFETFASILAAFIFLVALWMLG
jgi:hypothetical protein